MSFASPSGSAETVALHQLHLAAFESMANTETPYVVRVDSGVPGPHLFFGCGNHGNEHAGVQAALEIMRAVDEGEMALKSGSVDFALVNPDAYGLNKRFIQQDGNRLYTARNLDSGFSDTVEGRRGAVIFEHLKQMRGRLTAVLDFHSVSVGDLRMLVYNRGNPRNAEIARTLPPVFDFIFSYLRRDVDGALGDLGEHFGADGYSFECGGHSSPLATARALFFMQEAIERYGLGIDGAFPKIPDEALVLNQKMVRYETLGPIVPEEGFAFTVDDVRTGTRLRAGQVYAVASGGREYAAEQNCVIVMPDIKATFGYSDAGFLCVETG